MERETSGFDRWLFTIEAVTRELPLVSSLERVSRFAEETFGARVWFAEILGKRLSFVAGDMGDHPTQWPVVCIPLNGKLGLVSDNWGTLSEPEQAKLIAFLEALANSRQRS
jgi:hypothetical protein